MEVRAEDHKLDPFAATRELDIVSALRSREAHEGTHIVASDLMHEAANEIERLRLAFHEIASDPTGINSYQANVVKRALGSS